MIKLKENSKITRWAAKTCFPPGIHHIFGIDFVAEMFIRSNGYQHTHIDVYCEGDLIHKDTLEDFKEKLSNPSIDNEVKLFTPVSIYKDVIVNNKEIHYAKDFVEEFGDEETLKDFITSSSGTIGDIMSNKHIPKFEVGDRIVHITALDTDTYYLVTEICSTTHHYTLELYIDGKYHDKDFPFCKDADRMFKKIEDE